jgi:hypothetical protein
MLGMDSNKLINYGFENTLSRREHDLMLIDVSYTLFIATQRLTTSSFNFTNKSYTSEKLSTVYETEVQESTVLSQVL